MTDLPYNVLNVLNHVALQRNVMLRRWDMSAWFYNCTSPDIRYYLKGEVEAIELGAMGHVIPIDNAAAQQMMDDLWHGGIRPSTGVSSTGEAEALRGEINHLRAITTRIINAEWGPNDGIESA